MRLYLFSTMNGIPAPPAYPTGAPNFKDRSGGLIVLGIVEILLGVLSALVIPLMVIGQVMSAKMTAEALPLRQIIPGVIFYGIAAGVLVTLGIGSCKARRWARALSLILAWSWLAIGVFSIGMMVFLLPSVLATPQPGGEEMPEAVRIVAMVVSMGFMGIFFLVAPAVLVFFYRSPHVKATCEARDPKPRWTDKCPLPVVGLSLWLGFGAATLLSLPLSTRGVLPFFGVLLSGAVGSLACILLAALWAYSAWAVYRLWTAGWWIALITIVVMTVSALVTFNRIDLMEMYQLMGYPERQIEIMRQYPFMQGNAMVYFSLGGAIPMLAFLLFVKRYFRRSRNEGSSTPI